MQVHCSTNAIIQAFPLSFIHLPSFPHHTTMKQFEKSTPKQLLCLSNGLADSIILSRTQIRIDSTRTCLGKGSAKIIGHQRRNVRVYKYDIPVTHTDSKTLKELPLIETALFLGRFKKFAE